MLRLLFGFFLVSCSFNTVKKGGQSPYLYDVKTEYKAEDLKLLAPKVVTTSFREPRLGKLKDLFSKDQPGIKRIGIVVFESMIKNSITGVATEDRIYLSEQGKQLLTEKLLSIWEQGFPLVDPELEYVSTSEIKKTKDFKTYGLDVTNFINAKRDYLAPDDVYFLEKGKKIDMHISMNPRGMRDVSFLLVPATELMAGPKWSEHNKQYINDIAKNLNLDAVLIVQSRLNWTAGTTDKNSGEITPEQATIKIHADTLIPLSRYNQRLEKLGLLNQTPNNTLCYRSYESSLSFPVNLRMSREEETFDVAMKEVINPVIKAYHDLVLMTMDQLTHDLKQTR